MDRLDDFDGLLHWPALQEWVVGQPALPGSGPVTRVEALSGGSQNHLFVLHRADGAFVLRRPPRHLRANSNEVMRREARVLHALAGHPVPHPHLYAACDDLDVLGVCFSAMEWIDGINPTGALPGAYATDAQWRRAMVLSLVDGAAALAAVDHEAAGLADFGRADGWLERQVPRWRAQLESYSELDGYDGPDIPGVDEVGEWLEHNRPAACRIGIIHGDYHFANVMVARDAPRLAAAIDWELSTLGDPLLDLGWLLAAYWEPGDPPGHGPAFRPWEDMPTRAELAAHYCARTGRDPDEVPWYFVLACYKLGIILEGTHARAAAGKAPKAIGDLLHAYTLWLFAKARQIVAAH